jgi:molybdopterin-guanine dinucleotide biosynthesis protein A
VITQQHITGLILAGGRGMRMGGVDKGLQTLQGKPMVAHVIQRLQPQVDRIIINANQNQERYREFQLPVWSDQENNFAGPLAGIQAGLIHCDTAYMLIVPCDTPKLPTDLVTLYKKNHQYFEMYLLLLQCVLNLVLLHLLQNFYRLISFFLFIINTLILEIKHNQIHKLKCY